MSDHSPSRLEYIEGLAAQLPPGHVIAQTPAFYATHAAAEQPRSFHLTLPNVVDWAADIHGVDPNRLRSAAVLLETRKEGGAEL